MQSVVSRPMLRRDMGVSGYPGGCAEARTRWPLEETVRAAKRRPRWRVSLTRGDHARKRPRTRAVRLPGRYQADWLCVVLAVRALGAPRADPGQAAVSPPARALPEHPPHQSHTPVAGVEAGRRASPG